MNKSTAKLTLESEHWYAWEMLPGYNGGRYYSPILVHNAKPLKSGKNIIRLNFYNACYAEGVRNFNLELHIFRREQDYIFADLPYDESNHVNRQAIISSITIPWLLAHFPKIANNCLIVHSDERIEDILEELF